MNILTAMRERLDRLAVFAELDVEPSSLPSGAAALSDASVLEVLREVTGIANDAERLQSVVAGVAAQRSKRENGHSGLAATQGHASPVALVQSITARALMRCGRFVSGSRCSMVPRRMRVLPRVLSRHGRRMTPPTPPARPGMHRCRPPCGLGG